MMDVKTPAKLPDDTHHVIVKLETIHVAATELDTTPFSHEQIAYEYTPPGEAALIAERIRPASIVATTTVPINADTLGDAPFLKCVITETTGTNHIDLEECNRRGIVVFSSPGAPVDAVSEHALGLYFAARRSFVRLHNALYDYGPSQVNSWKATGSMSSLIKDAQGRPPHTCENETVGIIGFGAIGQRIAKLCQGLGMAVLVAERKVSADGAHGQDLSRIPFDDVIRRASVFFVTLPLTPHTRHTIGRPEIEMMRPDAVIINVGRGGTIDEAALVQGLREQRIHGAATDVFEIEPAGNAADSILLGDEARHLNLTLTPHLAWSADQTTSNLQQILKDNVRKFLMQQAGK
ncbi:D-isomer specific 2-hydroxyacid dehydrogenase [Dactylonectria estremocensis]|uniref:D-isomer specific 2-hydroxyacid dehydrogenase n=1 Tax=Dactylonectria estremocensis TaxID=1079267 RepID=A0A9P9DC63_9HYPO|nr:D-isomer specific 2-hydroxyacid dehydrogenase [Dactylonectria estremocensis]